MTYDHADDALELIEGNKIDEADKVECMRDSDIEVMWAIKNYETALLAVSVIGRVNTCGRSPEDQAILNKDYSNARKIEYDAYSEYIRLVPQKMREMIRFRT